MLTFVFLPLGPVGLATAGHGITHTSAGGRINALHDDKGPLLKRGHCQVAIVRHVLQEAAVTGPDGVTHLQNPTFVAAYLWKIGGQVSG